MLSNENWGLNEVGKTLNKAANLMDSLGIAKLTTQDSQGRVCIQGAVYMAISGYANCAGDNDLADKCFKALADHLPPPQFSYSNVATVCGWNNDLNRTKDEAVNIMRTVARTCTVIA